MFDHSSTKYQDETPARNGSQIEVMEKEEDGDRKYIVYFKINIP